MSLSQCTLSHKLPATVSHHTQQYIQYNMKTVYRCSEVERDPKLQKTPTKVYINLVCIDRKRVAREYDEVTRTMVQEGSLDVYGKK